MSITAGEINKQFVYDAVIDLSAFTNFTLVLTDPDDGTNNFTVTTPDVAAPSAPLNTPELGTLEADTYLSYQTTGLDFVVKGDWICCGFAEDGGTNKRIGPKSTVTILEGCP